MTERRHGRRAALLAATAALVVALPMGPAEAAWPGRNGRIAIESDATGARQIFARDLDGDDLVQLTRAGSNDDPSWSPDGRHLAFDSDRTGVPQLFVMRPDGSHQHNVSPDGLCSAFPSWSPDGERLVFSHYPDTDCSGAPDIWSARRDGSGATQLTHTAIARELKPVWSPDGRRIAFVSHPPTSGDFAVWTMASDGSDRRRLTPAWLDASYPDWSPDGRRVAVTSHVDREHSRIWVVDRDGDHLTPVTNAPVGTRDSKPAWSPDGRSILFSSDSRSPGQFELYRLDMRTGAVRRLTHTPTGEYFSSWQPRPRDDERRPDGD